MGKMKIQVNSRLNIEDGLSYNFSMVWNFCNDDVLMDNFKNNIFKKCLFILRERAAVEEGHRGRERENPKQASCSAQSGIRGDSISQPARS